MSIVGFRPGPKPGTLWYKIVSWFYGVMGWPMRPHTDTRPLPTPPPPKTRRTPPASHAGFIVPFVGDAGRARDAASPEPTVYTPPVFYDTGSGGYTTAHETGHAGHHGHCDAGHHSHAHDSYGGHVDHYTPCDTGHSHGGSGGDF